MTIEKSIRTRLEIIYTGSEILIPDPKSFGSADSSEDFIHMCPLCCQVMSINLFVADPNAERIRVTD